MILTVIGLLINLLPGLLQKVGISSNMSNLIGQLGAAVPTLITALASGQSVPDEVTSVLVAFQSEIKALQSNTNLSPEDLQLAATLDEALTDALGAYQQAEKVTDPSTLTPLPTNL